MVCSNIWDMLGEYFFYSSSSFIWQSREMYYPYIKSGKVNRFVYYFYFYLGSATFYLAGSRMGST